MFIVRENRRLTQSLPQLVLTALLKGDRVDQKTALVKWGTWRLSAHIFEVKRLLYKLGINGRIESERVKVMDGYMSRYFWNPKAPSYTKEELYKTK